MLIDFHTHAFPEKIAEMAIDKLSFVSGRLKPHTNGTFFDLKRLFKQSGIDKGVVLNIATNASQQKNVNDFAASINDNQNIFSFGSVFPDSPDALDELERIKDLGLRGVKLHPDYQRFFVDDEKMKPIYKKISELGLITLFHAGQDYGYAPPYGATPERMEKALSWFESPVIAAHLGGKGYEEEVLKRLCGKELYFDTAFSYGAVPKPYVQKIVDTHGADKILFGTDAPWHNAEMELRLISSLELSKDDFEKITYKNAEKLFGI